MLKLKTRQERGNVLVTAVLLISIMMAMGLAVASRVDTQTAQSRKERERESSFNLTEAALSAQTFVLGRRGTGTATKPYPAAGCPNAVDDHLCPGTDQLERNYEGSGQVDFAAGATWKTQVRDDADAAGNPVLTWNDSILNDASWPRYDSGGTTDKKPNRHVWVRSEATVRGHKRAIVAWVRIEDRPVNFPRYAILSGFIDGKNSGGHGGRPLVNSTGSRGVAVRCDKPPKSEDCINLDPKKGPQLQPPANYQINYTGAVALGEDDLAALEDVARANGTYYAGCPSNPNGDVVFVENAGSCRYTSSAPSAPGQSKCCNSAANPGVFVIKRGSVDFGGNIEYWGVVYNANLDNSDSEKLVETSGTSAIRGGVLVDGPGGVYAGSSGDNIIFNAFSFDDIKSVGTAGVVQSTWREIVPGT
ncbi:MAG TPA: hypothetical protein VEQ61_02715 [Thermoleophilaceae bacterium]|nr:hypothetical protein [Thermoleophilaceae bacterium]